MIFSNCGMNVFDVTTGDKIFQNKNNERCLTMNDFYVYMKLSFTISVWIFDTINTFDAM